MNILYFNCGMGAAGDMLTAALLDMMPDKKKVLGELNAIGVPGVEYTAERVKQHDVEGLRVKVKIEGAAEDEKTEASSHAQQAKQGFIQEEPEHAEAHPHADLMSVINTVDGLNASDEVKADILLVYKLIADAESKVHGVPAHKVHFHEVGDKDAIADVTAVCYLMDKIKPDEVICSPINVGNGTVECAHGTLPVPAPATAELLRGMKAYRSKNIKAELCTPTGAALLRHFVTKFGRIPENIRPLVIGYGMGTQEFEEEANCVRVMCGVTENKPAEDTEKNQPESSRADKLDETVQSAQASAPTDAAADNAAAAPAQTETETAAPADTAQTAEAAAPADMEPVGVRADAEPAADVADEVHAAEQVQPAQADAAPEAPGYDDFELGHDTDEAPADKVNDVEAEMNNEPETEDYIDDIAADTQEAAPEESDDAVHYLDGEKYEVLGTDKSAPVTPSDEPGIVTPIPPMGFTSEADFDKAVANETHEKAVPADEVEAADAADEQPAQAAEVTAEPEPATEPEAAEDVTPEGASYESDVPAADAVSDSDEAEAAEEPEEAEGEGTDIVENDVYELLCQMDDMTGEQIGYATEKLLDEGALDVFTVSVGMKKSRPGILLTVLSRGEDRERLVKAIFKYTSTIGVRENPVKRYVLERKQVAVDTPVGEVTRKDSEGYEAAQSKYEYEDLKKIADEYNMTVEEVVEIINSDDDE